MKRAKALGRTMDERGAAGNCPGAMTSAGLDGADARRDDVELLLPNRKMLDRLIEKRDRDEDGECV